MSRGGKRAGAGRPKGAKTKRTKAVAEKAAAEGITPLEVMLDAMRRLHKGRRYEKAAAVAKDAAPYVHPRLGQVKHDVSGSVRHDVVIEEMSDADLDRIIAEGQGGG